MLSVVRDDCSQLRAFVLQILLTHPASSMNAATMVPRPEKLSREVSKCKGFLLQGSLYLPTLMGTTEEQKIAQLISLLTGKVMKWVSAIWDCDNEHTTSYDYFIKLFK